MKITENLWKSINNHENLQKTRKYIIMYGVYLFRKKEDGLYSIYSKKIKASHICPPKRNKLFKQRQWKFMFSEKYGLWVAKCLSKSLVLRKSEMIPRSLRSFCPKRFLPNPWWRFDFWGTCWNPFFQKSGAPFVDNIRQFESASAAKSMTSRFAIDQDGPDQVKSHENNNKSLNIL